MIISVRKFGGGGLQEDEQEPMIQKRDREHSSLGDSGGFYDCNRCNKMIGRILTDDEFITILNWLEHTTL